MTQATRFNDQLHLRIRLCQFAQSTKRFTITCILHEYKLRRGIDLGRGLPNQMEKRLKRPDVAIHRDEDRDQSRGHG